MTTSIKRDSVKPPPRVVDWWQLDSKAGRSLHLHPGQSNLVKKDAEDFACANYDKIKLFEQKLTGW